MVKMGVRLHSIVEVWNEHAMAVEEACCPRQASSPPPQKLKIWRVRLSTRARQVHHHFSLFQITTKLLHDNSHSP